MSVIQQGTEVPKSLTVTRDGKTLVLFAVAYTSVLEYDLSDEKLYSALNAVEEHFQRIAARNPRFKPGKFAIPQYPFLTCNYDETDKNSDGVIPEPAIARCVVWSFIGTPDDILSAYDEMFTIEYINKNLWWWYDKEQPYANVPFEPKKEEK